MTKKCKSFDHLREVNKIRSDEWGGADLTTDEGFLAEMLFRSIELGGESGEVLNEVKKLSRLFQNMVGGKSLKKTRKALAEELADTIICCDRLAEMFEIDLGVAIAQKFNKTSDKNGLKTKF